MTDRSAPRWICRAAIGFLVDSDEDGVPPLLTRMRRCLELFEDLCVVAGSVRQGVDLGVTVEPTSEPPDARSATVDDMVASR